MSATPAQSPPEATLTAVQERVLEQLRRDGVATVSFGELFADDDLWERLEADMAGFVGETERALPAMSEEDRVAAFGKSFLVRRFRAKKGDPRPLLGLDNPWVRMGASPEILGVVNAYRGIQTRLHDFDHWYTVPDPDADRSASQRWHRDGWENHIVKVFTYFNDVDSEAGPFEYVLGSNGPKYAHLWPWQDKEVYPEDGALEAAIDPADVVAQTGVTGTIVFCDTGGFHRGGFAKTRPRILSYHTFLSDEAQLRHRRKFDVAWGDDDVPEATRYALG
jgi:hypothetical protein